MQQTYALSFKDLKQRITIEQVLRHYNLFETLELKGKSHRGPCPFCEAKDGSPFSVSLEKSCYQCFSCKASGNILEFVMQWEGVKVREAGEILARRFVHATDAHEKPRATPKPAEEKSLLAEEAPPPVPLQPAGGAGKRPDPTPSTKTPVVDTTEGETSSRNEPLSFALKNIEPDHPCVKTLGIHEDTITSFGVGYYRGRGMMENHIVIPIHNTNRQLVAYVGLHPEERTHIYPPKFKKELELFNLSGALADVGADTGVILVRHPLEALVLIAAGFTNAVAVMGDTVSEEQVQVLLTAYQAGAKVTLFWPVHVDIVPPLDALFPEFFIRLRRYEAKRDTPAGFTAEEVRDLIA